MCESGRSTIASAAVCAECETWCGASDSCGEWAKTQSHMWCTQTVTCRRVMESARRWVLRRPNWTQRSRFVALWALRPCARPCSLQAQWQQKKQKKQRAVWRHCHAGAEGRRLRMRRQWALHAECTPNKLATAHSTQHRAHSTQRIPCALRAAASLPLVFPISLARGSVAASDPTHCSLRSECPMHSAAALRAQQRRRRVQHGAAH
jgi:hypothetical protein